MHIKNTRDINHKWKSVYKNSVCPSPEAIKTLVNAINYFLFEFNLRWLKYWFKLLIYLNLKSIWGDQNTTLPVGIWFLSCLVDVCFISDFDLKPTKSREEKWQIFWFVAISWLILLLKLATVNKSDKNQIINGNLYSVGIWIE